MGTPAEILLELSSASNAACFRLPRKAYRERTRLELAVLATLKLSRAGIVPFDTPTPFAAMEQFKQALATARHAGVPNPDMVVAFNGDEERS